MRLAAIEIPGYRKNSLRLMPVRPYHRCPRSSPISAARAPPASLGCVSIVHAEPEPPSRNSGSCPTAVAGNSRQRAALKLPTQQISKSVGAQSAEESRSCNPPCDVPTGDATRTLPRQQRLRVLPKILCTLQRICLSSLWLRWSLNGCAPEDTDCR